jgi:glycosyltransferase involved in cell wall biosynthesis
VIEKGGETLLAAAQQLLRQRRDLEFVFFGDGPLRDALSQRATELGIASSVRFAGRVENMRDVYASLDVLCMPSLTEGLPLTLLEAMAAGVSVVATSVGEIPTVMSGNGILIEVGDARALANGIEQLLSDQLFRERVVAGARAKVMQKYTSSAMVNAYRQLYQELAP